MNCTYSFLLYSFFYFMRSIQKTLIQFARHGKLKQFSRLLHSPRCQANYDLSCNSVCSPRCSIHLTRKSSETTIGRLSAKKRFCWVDCLGRCETNCLLVTLYISSIVFVTHSDPQLKTGWAHGTTMLRNTWKNIVFPSIPHENVRYIPPQNT